MNENIENYISISEYAKLQGVDPATVRQKILRGNLKAVKLGRNWVIGKDTPYEDLRKKEFRKEQGK